MISRRGQLFCHRKPDDLRSDSFASTNRPQLIFLDTRNHTPNEPVLLCFCSVPPNSYRKPSRAQLGAGCVFDPLWPASGTPAGKPRSTSLHRPPLPHLLGTETSGGRGPGKRGSGGEGSQRRIPRGGLRPIQELLGATWIPSPPAALAPMLPSQMRQTGILRTQSLPLPPSLPHPPPLSPQ